ncbi:Dual-specificity kinase, spindle pole body (SPB) duplication and spindle checkpoint function [Mortierella sp. AD011]|nr:Dual-specificity kinase, spindle pole body (SPB) duplication and spindle checkpoint function [Mortierella sp. AD010]KAF9400417.1 Dual-specificity kinase, spindle pole body (SPB) duplication and spindle checkpoint function [Mortierella sp. AD011]
MNDLEAREKKRAPPPKLQPIKVDQLKDKEAYLADYFGEASLPFAAPSAVTRPPKRPVYSKAKAVSSNSLVHAFISVNSNSNSNSNDAIAESKRESNEPTQPSTSMTVAPNPALASDQSSTIKSYKSAPYTASVNGSSTSADAPIFQRLRSYSRLADQDSLQGTHSPSIVDSGKPTGEEPGETSEPKPAFIAPQPKLFRNPTGKENHLPQTSISTRSKNLKPIIKPGPRKSFNWGRPHRGDVPDPEDQEESKTLATTSDGSTPSGTETQPDQEKRESPTASAARSLESSSSDSSIQDLPMDDLSVSQTRGRQGSNRDYDESASITKKMKHDIDISPPDRVEFSPQPATRRGEMQTINSFFAPVSKSVSATPSSNPTVESTDLQKESAVSKITPKPQSVAVAADDRPKDREIATQPPRSPQTSRPPPSSTASHPAGTQNQKLQLQSSHAEGIASIAQHLAVGSTKAPPMPRPFSGQTDVNSRHGSIGAQKQVGGMATPEANVLPSMGAVAATTPATTAPGVATSTSMASSITSIPVAPGRPELGSRQVMMVNNRPYTKLAQVGKGGSSKVYKVLASNSRIFALKKVSFEKAEQATITGYVNEVNLLTRLANNLRIIRLWDAEINYSKGSLSLLMEYGEIDLAHMLLNQREQPFDIHFIGLYWRQMLEAVQVIHDEKIVHSDLKPANFLLVEGSLKLIDFGIANAIANDTTNIHREGQLGTANYMSPEAIASNPAAGGCRKLGRASDVWSLGCILYQMVYGKTPFSDVQNVFQKLNVITNANHRIEFPETVLSPLQPRLAPLLAAVATTENGNPSAATRPAGSSELALSAGTTRSEANGSTSSPPTTTAKMAKVGPDLIRIMKGCLTYQAKDRMNIPALLVDPFLHRN